MINTSKYVLSNDETKVLAKGLNFALTPEKVPIDDYVVATEQACGFLPERERDELRSKVCGITGNVKVPKPNISKEEKTALKALKKQETIMILPADMGKATVVMDKEKYEQKVKVMLSDTKTYEKLSDSLVVLW